jgi:MarR family transcriptional regulator, organic hydroperoxide resistance regulator
MNKTEAINEIFSLEEKVGKVMGCYAIESWRTLEVPVAQLKSLFIIVNKGETNFRSLAEDLGVTSGNMTGIVDRLVEQGLVIRTPDPNDRRVIRLKATEQGTGLFSNLMQAQNKHMAQILERMTEKELVSFAMGLAGFIRAVGEQLDEEGGGAAGKLICRGADSIQKNKNGNKSVVQ